MYFIPLELPQYSNSKRSVSRRNRFTKTMFMAKRRATSEPQRSNKKLAQQGHSDSFTGHGLLARRESATFTGQGFTGQAPPA